MPGIDSVESGEVTIVTTASAVRSLLLVVTALGGIVVGASSALAATPDTPYEPVRIEAPDPQAQGRWGERSALAGDIDGDGVGDFWMSAFQQDVGPAPLAGRVYLISGRTRTAIYSVVSPEPQAGQSFGFTVASPGDLNGDRKNDLVVGAYAHNDFRGESSPGVADTDPCGAPEPNGCYENTGQAWAYDGATGNLLHSLDNPEPQSNPELPFSAVFGFGTAISSAGDITGDGNSEVIVGASSNDVPRGCGGILTPAEAPPAGCRRDQGQAFVFNGATGALIRTYNLPAGDERPTPDCNTNRPGPGIGTCGLLGQTVQGLGDTDGDGVSDHLVVAGTYDANGGPSNKDGRLYVFSGRTGQLRFRIDSPIGPDGRIFGLQTVSPGAPGDVNGDGRADIYGNCFSCAGPSPGGGEPGRAAEGRAWIFSGQDGSILYNLFDPSPEGASGFAFSGTSTDFDGDGDPEFVAGQNGSGDVTGGGASIFDAPSVFSSSASAPALKDFQAPVADRQPTSPPPANGLRFGRTVEAPGDLNGDCEPDYVIGAPHTDVGANPDQGRVYAYLSGGPSACGGGGGGGGVGQTPAPTPTARIQPNMVRPGASAVQRRSRVLVRVSGRMTGVRGRPCGGRVRIGVRSANRRRAQRTVRMSSRCRYTARLAYSVKRLPRRLRPRRRVLIARVTARFQGNRGLKSDLSPTRRARVKR